MIMGIAIVALLAFGGTFAYFTATANTIATASNITTGTVDLTASNVTFTTGLVVPGDTILDGNLTYTSNSNVKTIVVVKSVVSNGIPSTVFALNINAYTNENATGVKPLTGLTAETNTSYYYWVIDANDSTPRTFISGISIGTDVDDDRKQTNSYEEGQVSDNDYMGKTASISFAARSIQYDHVGEGAELAKAQQAAILLFTASLPVNP